MGERVSRLPIALAVLLVVTAVPALADRTTVEIRDKDTLLVGDPTGESGLLLNQNLVGPENLFGTYKEYSFSVDHAENRLEVDLTYDALQVTDGPCLKVNDLNLYVEGPGWQRSYPGCDSGKISVVADNVPTGPYTVRVEATQGSTLCVPEDPSSCTAPGIEYLMEIQVWRTDV